MPFSNDYRKLVDARGNTTPFGVVRRFPRSLSEYAKFSSKHTVLGLCSYADFPRGHHEAVGNCIGWLHCFREPDLFLPADKPRLLLSNSDFTNPKEIAHSRSKEYDFVYVCIRSASQFRNKNIDLFKQALPILCGKLGLKGLVIGTIVKHKGLKCVRRQARLKFLHLVASSRFIFLPGTNDASPRVLSEALCADVPALVNRNILGGWKYINEQTGEFFDTIEDLEPIVQKLRSTHYEPRSWFIANHGPKNSAIRLGEFLGKICPKKAKSNVYYLKRFD
jgi:hypothetical protein